MQGEENISLTDAIPSTETFSPNEISEAKDEAVFLEDALPTANESVPEEVNQDAPSCLWTHLMKVKLTLNLLNHL